MGWASFSVFFLAAACLAGLSQVHAATYTVTNSIANDVNWNNLQPGDVVKIQYREQPYREKYAFSFFFFGKFEVKEALSIRQRKEDFS